jgi:uridine kinase
MSDIEKIASAVMSAKASHPIRVGIDGFCASGKTTLADALANRLCEAGRRVIQVCADDFQNPPEIRWQLGKESPESFYRFQIDFQALRSMLLEPLGPGGSLKYRSTCFDVRLSRPNLSAELTAGNTDVLLLDGLFLHDPQIRNCFDITVFVSADFDTCLSRALDRNQEGMTCLVDLEKLYRVKYLPGFALHLSDIQPEKYASFVVQT